MSSAFILMIVRELLLLRGAYAQAAPRLYKWSHRLDSIAEPLALVGLLAGIATALVGGWSFLTPWLVAAYLLIALSFVIGGKLVVPWQKRVQALAASPDGVATADMQRILRERQAMIGRWLVLLVILGILLVMRLKPSFRAVTSLASTHTHTEQVSALPTPPA